MKNDFGMLIRHGSENSIDDDYFLVVQGSGKMSNAELMALKKKVNTHFIDFDITIIDITEDGIVYFAMSGTPDEVNNGIFRTFRMHKQNNCLENPIKGYVERHIELKWLRAIRGILTHCSRTQYRNIIKDAIKSNNIFEKIEVLSEIDFSDIDPDDLKVPLEDFYKFIAFQVAQYAGLQNKIEIYTKNEAIKFIESGKCFSSVFCAPFSTKQIESTAIKMINRDINDINKHHVNNIVAALTRFPINLDIVKDKDGQMAFRTVFGDLNVKTEQYLT